MVFWAVFFAISILVAQNGSDSKPIPMGEVFFVSSQKELNTSLKQEGQLRGLAISVNYYQKSSEETKTRIEGLVERKLSMRNRPVFIYGQPFNNDLAKKLLVEESGSGCTPTVWAGVVPGELDGKPSTVKMCGADDRKRKDKQLREQILGYWELTKARLKA